MHIFNNWQIVFDYFEDALGIGKKGRSETRALSVYDACLLHERRHLKTRNFGKIDTICLW